MELTTSAWHYFLNLERDVAATTPYVELTPANYATFSDRFAGLLLLIGSEVDVVAKEICAAVKPEARPRCMKDYSEIILARYPEIHTVVVDVRGYRISVQPFQEWGASKPEPLAWWTAYNNVKHHRLSSKDQATQAAVLDALSGLLVLNLYLYGGVVLEPIPTFLNYGFPEVIVSRAGIKTVPGV